MADVYPILAAAAAAWSFAAYCGHRRGKTK